MKNSLSNRIIRFSKQIIFLHNKGLQILVVLPQFLSNNSYTINLPDLMNIKVSLINPISSIASLFSLAQISE